MSFLNLAEMFVMMTGKVGKLLSQMAASVMQKE